MRHSIRLARARLPQKGRASPAAQSEVQRMKKGIIYIHGKGGNAEEAGHYKPLFPDSDVVGFDYKAETPWQARKEFPAFFDAFSGEHESVCLIANSIGALFAMYALSDRKIEKAFFISPIVSMERLISDMMLWANVTEAELKEKGIIETGFGDPLSWYYLGWVREHPVSWNIPTSILYGGKDTLQSLETMRSFAAQTGAELTVMDDGEHWFHTQEQMRFLDNWIQSAQR